MTKPAIKVEGLWKEYVIGAQQKAHSTFYDMLSSSLSAPFRALRKRTAEEQQAESFWALRDVNFEVQPGEVVGIIGRNGAGKSTLLKILSRITAPTRGHVEVRGRLASLLEVGTGFHPELSGRENVFLNGAILGMSRAEVARKFDEIVAFAEVEKFIDTPVKRYSSGMYVRLAFAVAAHLEPEILIVDEVLAVGDAEFQRRCLGKMRDVAGLGRTIVFVSHNMQAVQNLCDRCVVLTGGAATSYDSVDSAISSYMQASAQRSELVWHPEKPLGRGAAWLNSISVKSTSAEWQFGPLPTNAPIIICMSVTVSQRHPALCIGFDLMDTAQNVVLRSYDTDCHEANTVALLPGAYDLICTIPASLLRGGDYLLAPRLSIHNVEWIVDCDPVVGFTTTLNHGESPFWNVLTSDNRPGAIAPILQWSGTPQ